MWAGLVGMLALLAIVVALVARFVPAGAVAANVISLPVLVALAWLSVVNQVRRWHDLGRSGWMIFISFIPVFGFLANVICLGFLRGQSAPNRFGPVPGAGQAAPPTPVPASEPPPIASGEAPPALAEPPRLAPAASSSPVRRRLGLALLGLVILLPLLAAAAYVMLPGNSWAAHRDWLRAEMGSRDAGQRLAWRYRTGDGVPVDFAKALAWFERAAAKGLPQAQYDAAVLHYYGLGVPADSAKAATWLEQAVQQDYAPAATLLGIIATGDGEGDKALGYWQAAAAHGDPWAESLLGSAYLGRRAGNDDENLILALYWMETARRDGAEPVGGQLQHVWATVPEDRLEPVTSEVFRRLEAGSPDPLPAAEATPAPATAEEAPAVAANPPETPADAAPAPDPAAPAELADEVQERVEQLDDYVALDSLYQEKVQADAAWADSADGQAVSTYLETMRSDAQSVHLVRKDDGTETLAYTIAGAAMTDDGVHGDQLKTDETYRHFIIEALAKNVGGAPKPLRIVALLQSARENKEAPGK